MANIVQTNSGQELRRFTPARIALGRVGNSLPTDEVLRFGFQGRAIDCLVVSPILDRDIVDLHDRNHQRDGIRSQVISGVEQTVEEAAILQEFCIISANASRIHHQHYRLRTIA